MYWSKMYEKITKNYNFVSRWHIAAYKIIIFFWNFFTKIFGSYKNMLYFCPLERWQSGRLRRSWKPLCCEAPGVRIPPSPLWIVYKKLIFNLVDFFYAQKVAPKMHRPRFYALLRAFFKLHISHTSYPIFSFCMTARNAWCNFSPLPVKKMHEKREPPL